MTWPADRDTELFAIIERGGRAAEHHPAAHRVGELRLAGRAWRPRARSSPTSTARATRASATTAATRSSTRSRTSPATGSRRCSAPSTPTCSPTRAPTPTWPCTSRSSSRATPCWACASTRAVTSRTARRSTPAAASTASCPTASPPSDERIDFDQVRDLALAERPKLIVAGATAYPRIIDPAPFRAIADEVGALFMFDAAHVMGLIAGGVHPSPVGIADVVTFTTHKTLRGPRGGCILARADLGPAIDKAVFPGMQGGPLDHVIAAKAVAFREAATPEFTDYAHQIVRNAQALAESLAGHGLRLVSGGTDNHLMLVDLRSFDADLSGKKARLALDRAGISLNENTVPDDPRPPYITSGLRIGTPAVTTQGMVEADMATVGDLIHRVLVGRESDAEVAAVRDDVQALCGKFTPYPGLAAGLTPAPCAPRSRCGAPDADLVRPQRGLRGCVLRHVRHHAARAALRPRPRARGAARRAPRAPAPHRPARRHRHDGRLRGGARHRVGDGRLQRHLRRAPPDARPARRRGDRVGRSAPSTTCARCRRRPRPRAWCSARACCSGRASTCSSSASRSPAPSCCRPTGRRCSRCSGCSACAPRSTSSTASTGWPPASWPSPRARSRHTATSS